MEFFANCAAFSPDGSILAVASWDGKCRIWNLHPCHFIRELQMGNGIVDRMAISPDNQYIVGRIEGGGIKIIRTENGKVCATIDRWNFCLFPFSSDSHYFLTYAKDSIDIWNTENGSQRTIQPELHPMQQIAGAIFTQDASQIWYGETGYQGNRICILKSEDGKELTSFSVRAPYPLFSIMLTTDNRFLACLFREAIYPEPPDTMVGIWDTETKEKISIHSTWSDLLLLSQDGSVLSTGHQIWDIKNEEFLDFQVVGSLIALSPDGQFCYTVPEPPEGNLWDFRHNRRIELEQPSIIENMS